jgi:hypothetical protein
LASDSGVARRHVAARARDVSRRNDLAITGWRNTTRKRRDATLDLLAGVNWAALRTDLARVGIVRRSKGGTVLNHTVLVLDKTLVNGLGQGRDVPAVEEVAVKPIAGRVTIGKHKPAVLTEEVIDGVEDLKEKMR